MGGSWGGEGLLYELLEGTDSKAAVAHLGVRGTLSLHLGRQRVAGDQRGSALGPPPLLLGPFPGEPGFAPREVRESLPLPSPSLTLGTLSNCTKVAVVPVLPPHQGGVSASSPFSPTASAPALDNLLVPCIPG